MTRKSALYYLLPVGFIVWTVYQYWPRPITEDSLAEQLDGAHCRIAYEIDHCKQRGFEPLRSMLIEDHDCDLWAVQCLMEFKSPQARQVMIKVLSMKSDVETCDGVRPVRSYAVKYLGDSGDRIAISPLRKLLANEPMQRLSSGASGCQPKPESLDAIRAAINKLEIR